MSRSGRKVVPDSQEKETVRFRGKVYPVVGELTIRHRKYLLLKRLAPAPRERFLAFDRGAGGELRLILRLPSDQSTAQHAYVLKRLPSIGQIPSIIDLDRGPHQTAMVLTWVPGIDLADYFVQIRAGRVPAPTPFHAVRLVRGLAHGLLSLHNHAQVIHADLKPHNLILTRKRSRLVLIDFGSAWPIERTGYRAPGDGISQIYAAPEAQFGDTPTDHRADQFSASLLLYQLLTNEIAYSDLGGRAGRPEYVAEMRDCLLPPSAVTAQRTRLPTRVWNRVDDLILRGLSLNPEGRFTTTNAWVDALDSLFLELTLLENDNQRHFGRWDRFLRWILDWRSDT